MLASHPRPRFHPVSLFPSRVYVSVVAEGCTRLGSLSTRSVRPVFIPLSTLHSLTTDVANELLQKSRVFVLEMVIKRAAFTGGISQAEKEKRGDETHCYNHRAGTIADALDGDVVKKCLSVRLAVRLIGSVSECLHHDSPHHHRCLAATAGVAEEDHCIRLEKNEFIGLDCSSERK